MLTATLKNKEFGANSDDDSTWVVTTQDTTHDTTQDNTHDEDKIRRLLEFCSMPRSRAEMMEHIGLSNRKHFSTHYLKPLLKSGRLAMTIPDKPQSKNQKYVKAGQ